MRPFWTEKEIIKHYINFPNIVKENCFFKKILKKNNVGGELKKRSFSLANIVELLSIKKN